MDKGYRNFTRVALLGALALAFAACGGTLGEPQSDCRESDFLCEAGGCVAIAQVCNGRDNCSDGTDEANCVLKCENRSDYRCKDGKTCLPALEVCDGRPDCPGGDDESTCQTADCDGFQCQDGTCVDAAKKCDGEADCLLAEDEAPGICSPTRCEDDEYRCRDGKTCIAQTQLCDGSEQCPQGDDEANAACPADGDGEDKGDDDDGEGRPGGGGTPGKPGENSPDEGRPCVSIDEKGLCDGDILSWCDNGQVEKRDCAREGKSCAQADPSHGYTCIANDSTPAPSECDGVNAAGSCNVDLLTFCSRGQVRTIDCSRRGQTCVPEGSQFRCGGVAQGGNPEACDGLTDAGICDGNTLRFCKLGQPEQYDCAASGMACEQSAAGASCEANACGNVTYEGECQGSTLRFCLEGARLVEIDCALDYGLGCGFLDEDIGFVCKPEGGGNGCGDLTFEGVCDGNTARWCENGQAQELNCAAADLACGDFDLGGDTVKACIDDTVSGGCGSITFAGECQGDTAVWCQDNELATKDCAAVGDVCDFVSPETGYYCVEAPATTCEGYCNELFGSDGVCFCDPSCVALGDCCDDFAEICE